MDIRGYVYQVADIFPGPLKTAARWVADRIFAIWDDVSGVFRYVVPRWRDLATAIANFTMRAVGALEKLAFAVRQIVVERIPRAIEALRQSVVAWVSGIINDVRASIVAARDWVLDQARRLSNVVLDFARSVYQWAIDRLREVWDTLSTVARLVGALLTDPQKFAIWAIGAIWGAFWRFADQHVDAIVEYIWARRSIVVSRVLDRAEAIIERML